jgi:HlyD family secretion protein
MTTMHPKTHSSMRRALLGGTTVAGLLAFGIGGWAATTELSGAVIAPGSLVVDSNVKKVQHPTGGVVGELRVRDGDHVKAGEVVVRLDDTQTQANLAIITKSLDDLAARQARDEAERDGAKTVVVPADLLARMKDPAVARVVQGEQKLFEIRRSAREGQGAQLRERIAQLKEQIQGLADQVLAKKREIALIGEELKGVRELWSKNLIPITRVTALERDAARIEGERGSLVSTMAQAKGKITETELQILQIEQDLRTEVGKDLAEIRAKTSELVEKKVAAEDLLKRVDIRAPQNGRVHQLAVHTVGGVITPQGEPIMLIVPEADALTVESKVAPQDIDFGLQPAHHAGAERGGEPDFSRRVPGREDGDELLHNPAWRAGGGAGAPWWPQARARHAGGELHPNRRTHGHLVPHQAGCRSDHQSVEGEMNHTR